MMLELRNIYKTYLSGKLEVPVLNGISLSVEEGEYVAIMGPSGSGKTTLMNIIGCLDSPTSGEYLLGNEDISQLGEKRMSEVRLHSIGFVFQSFYLLSRQSALENVALPLLYAGVRRKERQEIARRALERVGLGDRTDFKPTQLSGGQCQRVAIARAIVNNPKVILADEPTGALDTKSGAQIMEIFQSLNDEGVTIVMITHEPEIAAHAKRTLHIRDGLLVGGAGRPLPKPAPSAPPPPPFTPDGPESEIHSGRAAGTAWRVPAQVEGDTQNAPVRPEGNRQTASAQPAEHIQNTLRAAPPDHSHAPGEDASPAQYGAAPRGNVIPAEVIAAQNPPPAAHMSQAEEPISGEPISGESIIADLERQLDELKHSIGQTPAGGEESTDES